MSENVRELIAEARRWTGPGHVGAYPEVAFDEIQRLADAIEATLDKVDAVIESEQHYTIGCGWDVPVIRLLWALGVDAE